MNYLNDYWGTTVISSIERVEIFLGHPLTEKQTEIVNALDSPDHPLVVIALPRCFGVTTCLAAYVCSKIMANADYAVFMGSSMPISASSSVDMVNQMCRNYTGAPSPIRKNQLTPVSSVDRVRGSVKDLTIWDHMQVSNDNTRDIWTHTEASIHRNPQNKHVIVQSPISNRYSLPEYQHTVTSNSTFQNHSFVSAFDLDI